MKFQKFDTKPERKGSSYYLKFTDGQSVVAVLRGELHTRYVRWTEGKSEDVIEGTPGAKPRFSVNAIITDGGRFVARTWEFGAVINEALSEINDEYPLDKTKIKITRKGMGLDTEYKILPLLKDEDKLTPKQMAEIAAVELNVLDRGQIQPPIPYPDQEDKWNGF